MMRVGLVVLMLLVLSAQGDAGSVIKKALSRIQAFPQVELLENGGLEAYGEGVFAHWSPYEAGYDVDPQVAHGGRASARCHSDSPGERRGLAYHLELNQQAPAPIVAECWSKAEGVSVGARDGYSLYLDIVFADGTPLWGRICPFDSDTHDWQKGTVTIVPPKPIRSVSIYGLFRGRTGTVWFDDFSLRTARVPGGAAQFDGVLVEAGYRPKEEGMTTPVVVKDGRLALLATGGRGRVFVRDVAANSDFVQLDGKLTAGPDSTFRYEASDKTMQLALSATYRLVGDAVRLDGTLRDLSGKDRAISVYFAYPVEALGWRWYDDQRAARPIAAGGKYQNLVEAGAGATGFVSRFPLACVAGDTEALALAAPLDVPRLCRLGYDADSQELYAAVDLGLSPETARFPSSASFSLLLYRPEPAWGFRSALERYYQLNPRCFTKRNTKEGIWMPFTRISTVAGFEDFGFGFKEGDNEVPFDIEHGIYSFVYVEPWSYWLSMPPEVPRTPDAALKMVEAEAKEGKPAAQATRTSVMERPDGSPCVRMEDQPWCNGAVFGLDPSPGVEADGGLSQFGRLQHAIARALERNPQLSGVYHDSFEMYLFPNQLNYRREHFRSVSLPLVFDQQGRVCQYAMFSMVEFAQAVAQDMWSKGKLTFANGTPWQFPWGAAWLDVMGTETNWGPGGQYRADEPSTLDYWRAVCYQRPYLILLNTDYRTFKPEWVERYMKRCTAWALFPSMFSHNAADDPYWQNADLYNRDRPVFKRYVPVISALSAAGWEPVTRARSSDPKVYVERFGKPGGPLSFTVFNDSAETRTAEITFEAAALKLSGNTLRLTEALSGKTLEAKAADGVTRLTVEVGPEDVMVLRATR